MRNDGEMDSISHYPILYDVTKRAKLMPEVSEHGIKCQPPLVSVLKGMLMKDLKGVKIL